MLEIGDIIKKNKEDKDFAQVIWVEGNKIYVEYHIGVLTVNLVWKGDYVKVDNGK